MKNKIYNTWKRVAPVVIFLVIGIVALYYLVARPYSIMEYGDTKVIAQADALSIQGLVDIGQAWREYPNYMKGFSIIAGLSLAGAGWCCYSLSRENIT